ncbi:class I SAM-dependent methyltransferase [Rhodoplanes serenus]|uniref:class I SAM-dependent methyltransferase n=2 Tax=Rhodoplanes TaxID=29407 RepID=UPI00353158E8
MIEIGCGWSSACTLDTVEHYLNGECQITFIDPYPALVQGLIGKTSVPVTVLGVEVQNVPLDTFDVLQDGDVLFIDSTHVLRTGSDVCMELFEILPRLSPGVLVHFHDMF